MAIPPTVAPRVEVAVVGVAPRVVVGAAPVRGVAEPPVGMPPVGVPPEGHGRPGVEDDRLPPGVEPGRSMASAPRMERIEPDVAEPVVGRAVPNGCGRQRVGVVEIAAVPVVENVDADAQTQAEAEAEAEREAAAGLERDAGCGSDQTDPESLAGVGVVARREPEAIRNVFVDLGGTERGRGQHHSRSQNRRRLLHGRSPVSGGSCSRRTRTDRATARRIRNLLPCNQLAMEGRPRPRLSVQVSGHRRCGLGTRWGGAGDAATGKPAPLAGCRGRSPRGAHDSHLWIRNSAASRTKGETVSSTLPATPVRGAGLLTPPVMTGPPSDPARPAASACGRDGSNDGWS